MLAKGNAIFGKFPDSYVVYAYSPVEKTSVKTFDPLSASSSVILVDKISSRSDMRLFNLDTIQSAISD